MKTPELLWHNSVVSAFKSSMFRDIFTKANIMSKEVMKVYKRQEYYGFELEKDDKRYFLPTDRDWETYYF